MQHQRGNRWRLSHRFNRCSPALRRVVAAAATATGSVIGAPFNNDRTRHILAALHDCPKRGRRQVGSHTACSVGNLFVIIHPLTENNAASVCRPIGLMNFSANLYDALARREEYGHGVIHAVCVIFIFILFVIFILIFIDPGISRRVRLLAKVRMFKIQPPSFQQWSPMTNR